jgi:hypothetical protein
MNDETIYWVFSAAAQSIAAFIALLFTGYTLVNSIMESASDRDDTLEEVHSNLRKTYYTRLKLLAWITGSAILLSLGTVYSNAWNLPWKPLLIIVTVVVDISTIVGGLWFVVSIVDPSKYEKAAETVLKENKSELNLKNAAKSSNEFFNKFRKLEGLVRDYLKTHDLYVPSKSAPRMTY